MKRLLPFLTAALVFSCSGTPSKLDAGADAGVVDETPIEFDVSGTAAVHPDALNFLTDAGQPLALAGLTVRVEEPLRVALNDPAGVFSETKLDATATFSATKVQADLVNLGVAVGLRDEVDGGVGRVVRSATVIFDVALEGGKPTGNLTHMKAWAVPTTFHDTLTRAVTAAKVSTLTTAAATDLIHAGFILGRVVDASGQPLAGVTVEPTQAAKKERFFYPAADLATLGTSTSTNGLFVYVHNGGDVEQFRFGVTGKADYKLRSAGAVKDACLVMTLYPGTVAP